VLTFLYRLFLAAAALALAIAVYFFGVGLADGSVSSFNIALWLALLAGLAAILGGGWTLNSRGQRGAAVMVLAIVGVPALLAGLAIVVMIVNPPRWN
jgi:hypothetical protein